MCVHAFSVCMVCLNGLVRFLSVGEYNGNAGILTPPDLGILTTVISGLWDGYELNSR